VYSDPSGPNRSPGGQYYSLSGSSGTGEQVLAGIHPGDSYTSAQLKLQNYRLANNQDIHTGRNYQIESPRAWNPTDYRAIEVQKEVIINDDSAPIFQQKIKVVKTGEFEEKRFIGSLLKWLFAPIAVIFCFIFVLGALWLIVRLADEAWSKYDQNGGLVRIAAKQVFLDQEMYSPSSYLSAKDRSRVLGTDDFLGLIKKIKLPRSNIGNGSQFNSKNINKQDTTLLVSAYRCETDLVCRQAVERLGTPATAYTLEMATLFLAAKMNSGSRFAEHDICLLPIKNASNLQTLNDGVVLCARAAIQYPKSKQIAQHIKTMKTATWFKFLWFFSWDLHD
jgi:hypothetical protein